MYYLSFDIGGTMTKLAIIDEEFNFIHQEEYPTKAEWGGEWIIKSVLNKIKQLTPYQIKGIAIASGGVIDYKNGIVLEANKNIPNYANTDFKGIIYRETGLNASVENDVNCFALAETLNNNDDFLMITIGTGIGGAIVINKQIYHGHFLSAGEFGQIFLGDDLFENQASVTALIKKAQNLGLNVQSGLDVFNLYDQGNPYAQIAVSSFYNNLAIGIINLGYIFNIANIYLGGAVTTRETFLVELQDKINQFKNHTYFKSNVKITKYPKTGALIGAIIHYQNLYT